MLIFAIQNNGLWIIDCHFGVVVGVKTQQLPALCFTPFLAGRKRVGSSQEAPRRPPGGRGSQQALRRPAGGPKEAPIPDFFNEVG